MSGEFVIWDITSKEVDAIMTIFEGTCWGELAHSPKVKNPATNKTFPGWSDSTVQAVYANGVNWKGFPTERNNVPPHNYLAFDMSKINKKYGHDAITLQKNLSGLKGDYWSWLQKLAIVPIENKETSGKCSDLKFSGTRLSEAVLKKIDNVLDPSNPASFKHNQILIAFFSTLALGNRISLEIYNIDGLKIGDPNSAVKGNNKPHWKQASGPL